jgi:uncharacterized protein HemX
MPDDTYPGRDISEPLQPPQPASRYEKQRETAGLQQKIILVLIGAIAGAALLAGGYALAGNHAANLAPLQKQVTALQKQITALEHDANSANGQAASDASQISTLGTQVATLESEYGLLKIDGITTYNETCPIGGVWVPCEKNEPPGLGSAGG